MAIDFNSMMGYGAGTRTSPFTGLPDYLSSLQSPVLQGIDLGSGSAAPASTLGGAGFNDWLKSTGILGSTDADGLKTQGWGGMALGAASGLGNAFLGMQQYGLAKDTLNENKRQFQLNFDAQKKTTNARLEDRQAARVASNPGAYQSVGDYLKKYGV